VVDKTSSLGAHLEAIEACLEQVGGQRIKELAERILNARHIYLSGAGRTGLVVEALAMRLAQIGLAVHVAGESTAPAIISGDLLAVASGTGFSRTPLRHVEVAREAGARVVTIVGQAQSPLAEQADFSTCLPAFDVQPNPFPLGGLFEISLQLYFDLLVDEIRYQLRISEQDLERRHANLE